MKQLKKTLLTLVALLAVTTGAWADETPLVTINSTGYTTFTSGSKTFDDKVTVTFSNSVSNDGDHWGWYADDTSSLLTVAGINGYTITSCKFYTFDGTAKTGYTVAGESPSVYLNNDYVYTDDSKSENIGKFGISKIEVYGGVAPATYTVSMKEGTEDATSWTITPAEATTTGVAAGTEVKATYGGVKKVKSVKAKKKVKPAATVTTAPTAKTGVKAGQNEAIVNAGTVEGGTMMYMVNATQPASTEGFSATVPTAEGLTAGTYYVWYYVKADATHTDSEISASGIEVTIDAAGPPALNLTSPAVGQVIGDDGQNYDYGSLPGGVTAVAKICYVSGSNGLALALADEGQMNWSTAISTCAAHTPAFTGGTWKLATQDEWNNMITAAGSHTALRDGFGDITGASNLQSTNYWSSTEYDSGKAWRYNFGTGNWSNVNKGIGFRVRACLAF